NFPRLKAGSDRNRSVEIVRVSRPEAGNWFPGLRPGGGKFRMRMRDSTNIRKVFIQLEVSRQVGRRAKLPVCDLADQIGDNDLLRREFLVRHAAGLDGY